MPKIWDTIILGAGGAGLMCAAAASQRGARTLVLDHADKPGKKILISGGGRCNFTNLHTAPENFLSENPHFAKSALSRYTQWDFIDLVTKHGIAYHEKTLGQLFCDDSARQIVAMLAAEANAAEIRLNSPIKNLSHDGTHFRVSGETAKTLVIATGGPSIPKMGATGIAYDIAKQFGLPVIQPTPALVPFTLPPEEHFAIPGTALATKASTGTTTFEEASLFTHKGLSGPAILQISSYWQSGESISVNLTPALSEGWLIGAKNDAPKARLKSALSEHLPARLAAALADRINEPRELANVPDKTLTDIAQRLAAYRFTPNGTEGYAKAEVTKGGISTAALSSKTMESTTPGLYAIGEAVDVTGWLGGFNFQWAWSSGVAAGEAIAARSRA